MNAPLLHWRGTPAGTCPGRDDPDAALVSLPVSITCQVCLFESHRQTERDPEPFGHRGHPTDNEVLRSRRVGERLGVTLAVLADQGFNTQEAIAFIAGVSFDAGRRQGETWHSLDNARSTIEGLLLGRAAKEWSLGVLSQAMDEIASLLEGD